jgi:signal transduction histidine kinase
MDYLNSKVRYSISTYGLRVPAEEMDLIFGKQARGSNASEYTEEGLGMGLYIAKRILIEHGGNIKYVFEPKNARFGFNVFTFEV